MSKQNLKIAIQKSGRLSEGTIHLLRKCDIGFDNGHGKLKSLAFNFPLEILFLRDDDIPQYVADGVADCGIVGENVLAEAGSTLTIVERLGFGRCRLSIAVPRGSGFREIGDLSDKRIATSYPLLLERFLNERKVRAEIHTIGGSVEIAPGVGLSDAICDLVSSGSTLFTNGLEEVETIMNSEAVLVVRPDLSADLTETFESLSFRMRAVNEARRNKYILLNAPNERLEEIERLIPGMKSPTVLPLAEKGWSSIHSVIASEDHWLVVEKLKSAGAEGILVISIDQMIR
ncbi:MAG: ATP phosphoribosyltransferase [Pyrinomonadaceae bacterium]